MKKHFLFLLTSLLAVMISSAQIISGPMLGAIELREAKIWVEVSAAVRSVQLAYHKKGSPSGVKILSYKGKLQNDFNPVQFVIGGLAFNTTYDYYFIIDGKKQLPVSSFTTKDLWEWRKPVPDFSFIAGSCNYVNEPGYDRPGVPYGRDSSIFLTMAKEPASFMLWTGDNWYTREVDYFSRWGLWYRAHHDRKQKVIQPLLKKMPNYASWDDHDFGPNNSGSSYIFKDESRKVFMNYWANPSYGEKEEGIYTLISHGDVDIFLCDDRWWRSADAVKDSLNGKDNPERIMLGDQQMKWLKNSLLYSQATFKIVLIGSQVLNPVSPYDKLLAFSREYHELMDHLSEYKIKGVLFLSGDRHHSEIIKMDRPGMYPLYDITVSPLTSSPHVIGDKERNNPYRVLLLDQVQNYGRFTFSGVRGQRKLLVEYIGVKGEKLAEWSVNETDLK
jgi:alkaline phosphatase D